MIDDKDKNRDRNGNQDKNGESEDSCFDKNLGSHKLKFNEEIGPEGE